MFRDWTLDETLFVRDYAGTVPLSDLARHLRRDARDVAGECARLGVPFVYVGTPLFWCDECASWARRVDKSGRCDKCRSRHYLQRIEAKTAALMERLPLEQRETYARFESKRGGRVRDAPPLAPDTSGMPPEGGRRSRYGLFGRPERLGGGKGIPGPQIGPEAQGARGTQGAGDGATMSSP